MKHRESKLQIQMIGKICQAILTWEAFWPYDFAMEPTELKLYNMELDWP